MSQAVVVEVGVLPVGGAPPGALGIVGVPLPEGVKAPFRPR